MGVAMVSVIASVAISIIISFIISFIVCISFKNTLFKIFAKYIENEAVQTELNDSI